jgi:hypothetical protein
LVLWPHSGKRQGDDDTSKNRWSTTIQAAFERGISTMIARVMLA